MGIRQFGSAATFLVCLALAFAGGCSNQGTSAGGKRVILMTNGDSPYWDACKVGFQAGEKDFKLAAHGLRAVMDVNDGTPGGQIEKLRQYATQADIVAVGISVTDAANAGIADEMRNLQAKGVYVLAIDGDLDRDKYRDARFAFIGTDNLAAGRELGKAIKNLRPDGGELVSFVGRTGAQNAIERIAGTIDGAGDSFQAVDSMGDEFNRTRARDNVRNAIINHPKVNALAGIWSYNGPAIVDVVRELGRRKDFALVTFDAEPISIQYMAAGDLDCMVVQNPFDIGYQAARLMQALVVKDKATVEKMLPNHGQPSGDIYETGLKVVVPDKGSPLTAEMFGPKTEFLKLAQFKAWLAKYGLDGIMTGAGFKPFANLFRRGEFGLAIAVVVVVGITILLDPQRNYWVNPHDSAGAILWQTSLLGIFALGSAIVIISGGIDLSAGSMIAFGGTICATFMLLLAPEDMRAGQLSVGVIVLAILGTLFVGFLVGSLHAWLITIVELPPFVATLATLVGLRSLARAIVGQVTQGSTQITISDATFRSLKSSVPLPALGISVSIPLMVFLTLAVLAWILMSRTVVGRHLYALGGNETAARLSGIRTDRLKWLAYCIGAMLSSVAGILYVANETSAHPQSVGVGYELNAIAAAVVGGCSLRGGVGTIPGTVLGCLFLRVVIDGIAKVIKENSTTYEGLIVGIVVVLAVAFTTTRRKEFFPGVLGLVAIVNLTLFAGVLSALLGGPQTGVVVGVIALGLLGAIKFLERRRRFQETLASPGDN